MVVTSTQTPIRMPVDLKKRVEAEARRRGLSQADIIRLAIKEYLDKSEAVEGHSNP